MIRGRRVYPGDPREEPRQFSAKKRRLTFLEVGGNFKNFVTLWQGAQLIECCQYIPRQPAAPCAILEYRAAAQLSEYLSALPRQYSSENRRHLRRRHEVALRPQLRRARRVVTQTGRIERVMHVLRET